MKNSAKIGVFGGSGFYSLMDEYHEIEIDTHYGLPSAKIAVGMVSGIEVAFLPRHGVNHEYPPHKIPYLANIRAFRALGVEQIIAPTCVGSLQAKIKPGDFVICDQFIDRTSGRRDTFFDGPKTTHISSADPYCPELSKLAVDACIRNDIKVHDGGTCVVIQGPRFSTKAESRWFTDMGWDVINMTQYPECILAREQEMCYCNIALVTDYDAGIVASADIPPVSAEEVFKVLQSNNQRVKTIIYDIISNIAISRNCNCKNALQNAVIG